MVYTVLVPQMPVVFHIADQITEAARLEKECREREQAETERAVEIAASFDRDRWEEQKARILSAQTPWLVAHTHSGLPCDGYPAPVPPPRYAVVATDGSQILLDRHEGAGSITLLNTGRVMLSYGTGLRSRLDSQKEVIHGDGEIADDANAGPDPDRDATSVGAWRFAREMRALTGLIEEIAETDCPAVAFMDDPLVAFFLPDKAGIDAAQDEAFEALMETFRTAQRLEIPLIGYISEPRTRYAVGALRITLCREESVDCARCCQIRDEKPCYPIRRVLDAGLYRRLLKPGERSAVYWWENQASGAPKILTRYAKYSSEVRVAFFYLNTGNEIARIEIPVWVAENSETLDRVHAICMDQARKGQGYPVALAEAHEQAVLRGADRQGFLTLIERALVREGASVSPTRKAFAKRTRSV